MPLGVEKPLSEFSKIVSTRFFILCACVYLQYTDKGGKIVVCIAV